MDQIKKKGVKMANKKTNENQEQDDLQLELINEKEEND